MSVPTGADCGGKICSGQMRTVLFTLKAVLANISDELMQERKQRTKFSQIFKHGRLQEEPPIIC
jgi:hypothetical protein